MKVRVDVVELLRAGLSNAEISRRLDVNHIEVGRARKALHIPDHRDLKTGPVAADSRRAHGTRAKYVVEGCRCRRCKKANRREENHRTRMQAYGRWEPYVDAGPVRGHVRALQEFGLGWKRIAALAGVSASVVSKLLYGVPERGMGPSKRVRPETAARLLAVRPDPSRLAGHAYVDATGTRRRLQALVAGGWPQARLASRLDMTPSNFGAAFRRERVLASTARAVAALYDELWCADPREHGVDNQAYSRARNHAAAHDWAPAAAWDDDLIDDPTAGPDTGAAVSRAQALVEDATWLIERQGYTREQAAARLGVSQSHLGVLLSAAAKAVAS